MVDEEEWVERQGESEDQVQCKNLRRGHYNGNVYDPILHNCYRHHERWARGVVRDGGSVDEVTRDDGDQDWRDEKMR